MVDQQSTRSSTRTEADPLLSVIVTIVEGGEAVRRLLTALTTQVDGPPMEILVPYDTSAAPHVALSAEFPTVRFMPLGVVATEQPITSAGGEHELFDRRRAAGLAAATGDLIAIVEDRGAPRQDWARTAVRLHRALPHGVIGGAIDPLPTSLAGWAVHVCDFTRYTSPFDSGPRDWVSDVNVVYKRRALEQTRALWRERYQEPVVHWSLQQQGDTLYLSDELVVEHHRGWVPLGQLLHERYHWGRLFGAIRARHLGLGKRLLLGAAGPLIPFTVLLRHARAHAAKGNAVRFLLASPMVLLYLVAWTLGEVSGMLSPRA